MELVSASEAARQLGVHRSVITRDIQRGLIPNHAPGGRRPLVNVAEAREARRQGLDRSKQRGPGAPLFAVEQRNDAPIAPALAGVAAPSAVDGEDAGGRDPSYQMSRARRESAAAAKAEIELAQIRKETLSRAEVVDAASRLGQMLREGMEARRAALAERLAGLDVFTINKVLADANEALLEGLAGAMEREFAPDGVVAPET